MNIITSTSRATKSALLSACIALGAAAAVQAGEACAIAPQSAGAGGAAITVGYSDLNLATPEGARVLYSRIDHAAHKVCDAGDFRNLDATAASRKCERAAVAQAVQAVHSPQLAALVSVKMPQG
jgi:UrcA family protein